MRILLVAAGSWLSGLLVYLFSAALAGAQLGQASGLRGTLPDLQAVAFLSLLGWAFLLPVLYLPAMLLLRRLLAGPRPAAAFPLVGAALALVAAPLQLLVLSGFQPHRELLALTLTPEGILLSLQLGAAGAVFGQGFLLLERRRSPWAHSAGGALLQLYALALPYLLTLLAVEILLGRRLPPPAELPGLLTFSLYITFMAFLLLLAPAMLLLEGRLGGRKPAGAFVLLGFLLGVPTLLLVSSLFLGGPGSMLSSPRLYLQYGLAGAVAGAGFVLLPVRRA